MNDEAATLSPLRLVLEAAGDFGARILASDHSQAVVQWTVPCDDGQRPHFTLELSRDADVVTVKEKSPALLPAFCPELHINRGGTFCLGLRSRDRLSVTDSSSAKRWWGRLLTFLRAQIRARKLRRWPDSAVWLHGKAADHQADAEDAAQALGRVFESDLATGKLSASRASRASPNGHRFIRVLRKGTVEYTVWDRPPRVANRRQRCICTEGSIRRHRRLKQCGTHEAAALKLAVALYSIPLAEREFWEGYKGETCCGRVDQCPLRTDVL